MAYSIEYIYRIIDKYSPMLDKMKKNAEKFSVSTKKSFSMAGLSARLFSINLASILSAHTIMRGIRNIKQFASESTKAFDFQQAAIASVGATLESTGGTVGRTLHQIQNQAKTLQKETFLGDESILQGVSAQLLTFTNITEGSFDRAGKAVVDVSAKLNGLNTNTESLRAVSIMLGKALNDPVANLGALSRSGIQFSKQQKEMIKMLWNSGKVMKAQNMILTEIEKQYGGTAATIAKTAGGMRLQLRNQIGDIKELIGKALLPLNLGYLKLARQILPLTIPMINALSRAILKLSQIKLDKFTNLIGKMFNKIKMDFKAVAPQFKNTGNRLGELAKMIAEFVSGYIQPFIDSFLKSKGLVFAMDLFGYYLNAVIDLVKAVIKPFLPFKKELGKLAAFALKLGIVLNLLPFAVMITASALLVRGLTFLINVFVKLIKTSIEGYKAFYKFINIGNRITRIKNKIVDFAKDIIKVFKEIIKSPFFVKVGSLIEAWISGPERIKKAWQDLKDFLVEIFEKIKSIIEEFDIGKKLSGLKDIKIFQKLGFKEKAMTEIPKGAEMPKMESSKVNVNATMNLDIMKEKGITVIPYKKRGNLGMNMAEAY